MKLSRQLTRREKVLMVILAVLLLFALYFFAVDRPVKETMARVQTESADLSTQLTVLEAKAGRMRTIQKELDAILAQPDAAKTPDYDNLEQVMAFLDSVLISADEYTLSFSGAGPDGESNILRRNMNLSFTCSSYDLARVMVWRLQECPYRCQISVLSMTPALQDGARSDPLPPLTSGPVTATLSVTFFESTRN